MSEIRHDTTPMRLDEIQAALAAEQRETLPLPVDLDREPDVAVCCACGGSGLVKAAQ